MKDKEALATCPSQRCQACKRCVFGNRATITNEWEMDLTPIELGLETPSRIDERIRLDTAIEAAALAG